jgi:nicotinate-nucleotide adenylyltransferase
MRIGLLGGSFNPAHAAHREISLAALKRLGLDQVWWLVTAGNPLKDVANLPPVAERVADARRVADHPRITVTGFDGGTGSPYTADLLAALLQRYPGVDFVWLMGADNLVQLPRWRAWERLFRQIPIAVFDRPGYGRRALAGRPAKRFSRCRLAERQAARLAQAPPPAWVFIHGTLDPSSSTALRQEAGRAKG